MEETLQRIKSHKGVEGILIVNRDGVTLKSTLDEEKTREYAASLSQVRIARGRSAACSTADSIAAAPALLSRTSSRARPDRSFERSIPRCGGDAASRCSPSRPTRIERLRRTT